MWFLVYVGILLFLGFLAVVMCIVIACYNKFVNIKPKDSVMATPADEKKNISKNTGNESVKKL